ncbi:MAG: ferric reductase-like transmembrane domain-containing protein [Castellaniella sp.]
MLNIQRAFWASLIVLTLLWMLAEPRFYEATTVFEWRRHMRQYTGLIAMGAMSLAMLLALRPRWPERWLGGLDKMYRLHKWLGINALIFSVFHWLWIKAPKWAVSRGLLEGPARGGSGSGSRGGDGHGIGPQAIDKAVETWLHGHKGLAEFTGEWAFYAAIILIVLALIRCFPYHWFYKSHRLLAIAYLVLVFHSVVLMEFAYWSTPLGWLMTALLAGGTIAAVLVLLGRVGAQQTVTGTIASLNYYKGVDALEITADVPDWPGHRPGQFAFATSDLNEGAHPYTIASAWNPERPQLTAIIKGLGDHTRRLRQRLQVGQALKIEGPYGCFTFDDGSAYQIWVGAGIGITPFISRLDFMQLQAAGGHRNWPDGQRIDLFHSTADVDREALARLVADAHAADVRLHVFIDARHGRLTGRRIRDTVPHWREASIWFCGPTGFADALRRDFAAQGFPVRQRFHHELFQMR